MRVRVFSERLDVRRPAQAARKAVAASIGPLARSRDLLVLDVELGDGPGLRAAPWTLDGVLQAATDAGLHAAFAPLRCDTAKSVKGRRPALPPFDDDRRAIALEVRGAKRPRRIPHGWFGKHLCLVVPCVHIRRESPRHRPAWTGPVGEALNALAGACTPPDDVGRAGVGAHIVSAVFASTTILIDGSWWGPLRGDEPVCPMLVGLGRCLSVGASQPTREFAQIAAAVVDAWLADRLRLSARGTAESKTVIESGSAAHDLWPRAPSLEHARPGLAGKTMAALWSGRHAQPRLPPNAPGPLGRLWHAYDGSAPRMR